MDLLEETDVRAKRTWIFIGDGVRARIVANDGPGTGLSPVPKRTFARRAPPTKEIGADRPSTYMYANGMQGTK